MVADDHPLVRRGIRAMLEDEPDLEVVGEADDGAEAVRTAEAFDPDVVLMDLRMPVLGGSDATARILAGARARQVVTRVLVLTTFESDADVLSAIEAGASGYLLKAAPHDEVVAAVRAVAAGRTVLAPGIAEALVRGTRGHSDERIRLSEREVEVLRLVATGASNARIAADLYIAESTVKTHLVHVFEKLGVDDRTRAVTRAQELGIL
nr:response regulator transcription factor [Planctomonas sp. JC2975]